MSADSTRGTITAADLAASEEEWTTAEEALLKALSEVRREKSEAAHADD